MSCDEVVAGAVHEVRERKPAHRDLEVVEELAFCLDRIVLQAPGHPELVVARDLPQVASAPVSGGVSASEPCKQPESVAQVPGAPDVDRLRAVEPLRSECPKRDGGIFALEAAPDAPFEERRR